ncbi:MAG TPA: hypothetical protein VNS19_11115 [Acidimicrobiales bacterium]|nr:hypothetical protein [Acidimicrobiales bacterium]
MIRRRNAILLALGLIAPLALVDAPAGAIDQDLVVSTAAGPPGTAITVSSASCEDPVDENAIIEASLYVGTAPDQQIAAYGSGYQGSVVLTVPDWVDPDQPAVIEASCYFFTEEGNDDFLEYDPVAFDIEPGIGAPVQVRTFSRTELLAGQGLIVNGSCGPDLANSFVTAAVFEGTDQTGKELTGIAGQGWAEADGDGAFELNLIVNDAFVGFGIEGEDEQVLDIVTEEVPMSIEPGDYTAFVYCSTNTRSPSCSSSPSLSSSPGPRPPATSTWSTRPTPATSPSAAPARPARSPAGSSRTRSRSCARAWWRPVATPSTRTTGSRPPSPPRPPRSPTAGPPTWSAPATPTGS